ncbi:UDP-2,4-diacetamido-2,4,6-trideoxy-beta-L-altropyranose hydrolase, partial [bacterium]|nr:UDP-2,4-diacetamido-2,4,6-trideoxy-beta-L-altropyranose hydrolase [bacterium]
MNCHLLIRADVGPTVGTGHVMRTAALAMAFNQLGGEATIACNSTLPERLKSRLEKQGISVVIFDSTDKIDDAIQTRQLAENLEADWIVADGYGYDDEYQHILKLSLAKLMVVDDFGHGSHRMADLVLNQNIYSDGSEYSSVRSEQVICGSRFVLLRSEFKNLTSRSSVPKLAKRILLTFGGADEHNFTAKCLQALGRSNSAQSFQVDVVLG